MNGNYEDLTLALLHPSSTQEAEELLQNANLELSEIAKVAESMELDGVARTIERLHSRDRKIRYLALKAMRIYIEPACHRSELLKRVYKDRDWALTEQQRVMLADTIVCTRDKESLRNYLNAFYPTEEELLDLAYRVHLGWYMQYRSLRTIDDFVEVWGFWLEDYFQPQGIPIAF